jgi:uncharacterized membrane protein
VEELIRVFAHYIALFAEGIAVLFIVVGIAMGGADYVRYGLLRRRTRLAVAKIRNDMGHMLSLALEFLIGADILKTAISPTWTDIGQLGAIVGIRTILNFFLMQELKHFGADDVLPGPESHQA